MKAKDILVIGALGVGAVYLLTRRGGKSLASSPDTSSFGAQDLGIPFSQYENLQQEVVAQKIRSGSYDAKLNVSHQKVTNALERAKTQQYQIEQSRNIQERLAQQQTEIGSRLAQIQMANASYRGGSGQRLITTVKDASSTGVYLDGVYIGEKSGSIQGTVQRAVNQGSVSIAISKAQQARQDQIRADITRALTVPNPSRGSYTINRKSSPAPAPAPAPRVSRYTINRKD